MTKEPEFFDRLNPLFWPKGYLRNKSLLLCLNVVAFAANVFVAMLPNNAIAPFGWVAAGFVIAVIVQLIAGPWHLLRLDEATKLQIRNEVLDTIADALNEAKEAGEIEDFKVGEMTAPTIKIKVGRLN